MNEELFAKVDQYIDQLLAPEDDALASTIKSLDEAGMPNTVFHQTKGNFCKFLQSPAMQKTSSKSER